MKFVEGDWRAQWLTPDRLEEGWKRVQALEQFLDEDTPNFAALALKFCLAHPATSSIIPGMRKTRNVEMNTAASDSPPLSTAVVEELKNHAFVHGWPYPWIGDDDADGV
jgi:aryl-alcohol dehydrogenase-like predicted oxidoreductase